MASLYNIEQKYFSIIAEIENNEGEITPELAEQLAVTEDDVKNKLRAYYYIMKQKEGEMAVIDDEIERLKNLKDSKANLIERLKKACGSALMLFGTPTKTGNYKLELDDLTLSNVFHKPLKLDEDFNNEVYTLYTLKEKLTKSQLTEIAKLIGDKVLSTSIPSADKVRIKEDLLAGAEIKGARISTEDFYIRFR